MPDSDVSGHRQRLRYRFLSEAEGSRSDQVLLELLLTFAIPQRNVQPLAKQLISRYGGLSALLAADTSALLRETGLGPNSVVLLKLVDWIRGHGSLEGEKIVLSPSSVPTHQEPLFDWQALTQPDQPSSLADARVASEAPKQRRGPSQPRPRTGTGLFSNALLQEAVDLLPELPDTSSLDEVKAYLVGRLHFSALSTRQRYAQYIARRMFPSGQADRALRAFARRYAGRQELRDVCFYRFCVSEPFMMQIIEEALLPALGRGQIGRDSLRDYLALRFPERDTTNSLKAIVDALLATGWIGGDNTLLTFSYRQVLPASLAFVLHSEFPEPGMYPIGALEAHAVVRSLLWNPDGLLPGLYELRNLGLLSKVSEIDDARQFTVRYTLDEVVDQLR